MRNKRLITGLGLIAVCSILFTVSSSLMWFDNKTTITPDEVTGSSDGAYYASGSGTKDDPYIINQPRHLYNLAWLQYLGAYNKDTDGDGKINEIYFEVEGNTTNSGGDSVLDMDGWVLPPLGTEDNPFVGNFNGNNTIIKNLTVSNTFSDYEDNHPYYNAKNEVMSESTFTQPKIIGFFGVIGALDSQTYEYSKNIAVEGAAYTDANLVYDTYVDNITIENNTENQELLAGLLVGYVNAPIIQSGVGYGEFDFASGTTNLSSSNTPSGATINGVSNYSLIGAYNPNSFKYTGLPTTDSGSGDQGDDWGGTIDFYDIHKRLTFMVNSKLATTETKDSANITKYGNELQTQRGTKVDYTTNSSSFGTFEYTTLIPINITNEINQDYYSSNSIEAVNSDTNNGYIVGTNSKSTNFTVQARKINEDSYNVSKSFNDQTTYTKYTTANGESNLSLMTIKPTSDNSSPIYQINDEHNTSTNLIDSTLSRDTYQNLGLTKYKSVRDNLNNIYSESPVYNGTMINYYLRWGSNFNINSESSISSWPTFTGDAQIEGTSYTSYEFLRASINFTSKESGVFVAIFTPWGPKNNTPVMNGLIDVTRDSNGKVTSKKRIDKVYKDSAGKIKYTYSDNSTKSEDGYNSTDETLAYSFSNWNITTTNVMYAMYYCEIPVMAGDYVFGRCDLASGYAGCSYNYIDIGSNGDSGSGDEPSDTSPTEIDFVYYGEDNKLVKITFEKNEDGTYKYINSEVVFQIGSSGSILSGTYSFNRTTSSAVLYYQASEVITVIGTTANAALKDNKDDVPKNN